MPHAESRTVVVACRGCGTTQGTIRALRARLFTVYMCEPCSLSRLLTNEEGREIRVIAVATERFKAA